MTQGILTICSVAVMSVCAPASADATLPSAGSRDDTTRAAPAVPLYRWGARLDGSPESTPTSLTGVGDVVAIDGSGYYITYYLQRDGTVLVTAGNNFTTSPDCVPGQRCISTTAVPISGLYDVTKIAAMNGALVALRSDGTVWVWHTGTCQSPDQTGCLAFGPQQMPGLNNIVAIAASSANGYAVRSDGTLWAWGPGGAGALGTELPYCTNPISPCYTSTPVQAAISNVAAVAADDDGAAFALLRDGTVWAWGDDSFGQVPNGSGNCDCYFPYPTQVVGLEHIVAIAGSFYNGYALQSNGTVWSWGNDYFGQLGDGGPASTTCDGHGGPGCGSVSPVRVLTPPGITAITAGGTRAGIAFAYARRSDGTLWGWGYNQDGQLGNGTTTRASSIPARVKLPAQATTIAADGSRGYAILGNNFQPPPPPPAPPSTSKPSASAPSSNGPGHTYVALGDSYSAGEGLKPYYPDTQISRGNECHRSGRAYSQRVLKNGPAPIDQVFRACSGALIDDFYHKRGFDVKDSADDGRLYKPEEPAQVVWLGSKTRYVTLTIAGNDVFFAHILGKCHYSRTGGNLNHRPSKAFITKCASAISQGTKALEGSRGHSGIRDRLVALYKSILSRAPGAQVRILNYPILFPEPKKYDGQNNRACIISGIRPDLILDQHVTRFRTLNKGLNKDIAAAIKAVRASAPGGTRLKLADVQKAFGDHTISCGDKGRPKPWINAGRAQFGTTESKASFHPNKTGQCNMALVVNRAFAWKDEKLKCK